MSTNNSSHVIVWFEIPVTDLKRADIFYRAVLNTETGEIPDFPTFKYFEHDNAKDQVAGGLCVFDDRKPSQDGPLIYLNVNGRLDDAIEKVKKHGGKVLEPKNQIGEYGYRAIILDTEGNRIALHSK